MPAEALLVSSVGQQRSLLAQQAFALEPQASRGADQESYFQSRSDTLRAAIGEMIEVTQIPTSDYREAICLAAFEALRPATSDVNTLLNAFAVMQSPSVVQP